MDDLSVYLQLSESYPVRRAAQLTAYLYHRGKCFSELIVGYG